MNVFAQELKSRIISMTVWGVSMIAFLFMCMLKFKTITVDSSGINAMMNQFPGTIKAVFGMSGLNITTLEGYYGMCFLFIVILLAVHSGMLAVNLVANEGLTKTTEFLYTKPVDRLRVLSQKILAGMVQLALIWALTYIGSLWSISAFTPLGDFGNKLWQFMLAAGVVQIVFFAAGIAFGVFAKSASSPAKWMSGLVFGMYFLSVIAQFRGYGALQYVSVFSYFSATNVLQAASSQTFYMIGCIILSIIALIISYAHLKARDLTA